MSIHDHAVMDCPRHVLRVLRRRTDFERRIIGQNGPKSTAANGKRYPGNRLPRAQRASIPQPRYKVGLVVFNNPRV